MLIGKLELLTRRRFVWYQKFYKKVFTSKSVDFFTAIVTMSFIVVIYIDTLAKSDAEAIKAGTYSEFQVKYVGSNSSQEIKTLALLGGATRYNYYYETTTKQVIIIPISSTLEMVKNP